MLASYIAEVRSLLNDGNANFFTEPTLVNYINAARRRIAYVSECMRCIPPGVQTVPGQEQYPVSAYKALIQEVMPQAQSILAVNSLAVGLGGKWIQEPSGQWRVAWGSWKPVWRQMVWTKFQADLRIYGGTFIGQFSDGGWWAQYGSGPDTVIFLAPIPTMRAPMELDVKCIPQPLLTDDDSEPIPYPWQDAVKYWAATLALLQQQRAQDAQAMATIFNDDLPMCAAVVCPRMVQNAYGATLRSA